ARIDPSMADAQQALDVVIDQATELSRRLRRYQEQIEFNPERLEEIEERLNLIRTLERKYGSSIEDVIAFAEQAREQLDQLTHREEHAAELDRREQEAIAAFADVAMALSIARQSAPERPASDV